MDRVCAILDQRIELLICQLVARGAVPPLEVGHLPDGQVAVREAGLVVFYRGFGGSFEGVA